MGNHGDRLTSPLRRRPDGGHEPVDWDTALTEIAARLHAIRDAEARGQRHQERPNRKMIVIDPRRTETAEAADLHLALHPGTDAYLLAAILALIVRRGGQDDEFLAAHTDGFAEVAAALDAVPADEWIRHAEVDRADVERAVDLVLAARAMTVRVELGIQQGRHSTLNSYLEKLLYLVTGNFGRRGTNNLHSWLMPLWGNSNGQRSEITGFSYIGGLLPANTLAEEVLTDHPHRIRVLWVESSNPANTYADTAAVERAIRARELSVVVEVACAMAPLWVGCHRATATMTVAVQRALGSEASGAALGEELFERITTSPSGTAFSTPHLRRSMGPGAPRPHPAGHPRAAGLARRAGPARRSTRPRLPVLAGQRTASVAQANQILRHQAWRGADPDGAPRARAADLASVGVDPGDWVAVVSRTGRIVVRAEADESLRPMQLALPHGYGMSYPDGRGGRVSQRVREVVANPV